jgi:PAS domain S-box-containing protein
LKKSLFLIVLGVTVLVEMLFAFSSMVVGLFGSLAVHAALFLLVAGSLFFFRTHFNGWFYSLGLIAVAWTSSTASLVQGLGTAALMWHLILPTGFLILKGEKWGWVVLIADFALAVVHELFFLPNFHSLSQRLVSPLWVVVSWEVGSILCFLLFLTFLRLAQQTLAAYQAENGRALDLLSQAKDSEARWADQARFLETLMDVIPFPLYHKGSDGRYLSANASFRVVFEVQKDRVKDQKSEDFLRAENAKTLAKIELDLLARDSMAVEEATLIHADGLPHSFIVYLMPFADADQMPLGSIGVLIDITERKLREEKLVQLNATKDQLFSIISHDLRGPVGKLKQLLDIYMDDPGIFDKASWDQVFHDMRRSADSLFQLLENLLSWARSQQAAENVRYESIALEPIVADVFSVLKLLANEKKITLEMDIRLGGPLLTDRHVLSTIIRNLVHNALKFSLPGGKITVTAEETPAELWIEVRDRGVGMSPETLHRIFEKKERLTTFGTGKEKGQGIGLGLCQDLAASLGAHLVAQSRVGEGTTIRLDLPTPEL